MEVFGEGSQNCVMIFSSRETLWICVRCEGGCFILGRVNLDWRGAKFSRMYKFLLFAIVPNLENSFSMPRRCYFSISSPRNMTSPILLFIIWRHNHRREFKPIRILSDRFGFRSLQRKNSMRDFRQGSVWGIFRRISFWRIACVWKRFLVGCYVYDVAISFCCQAARLAVIDVINSVAS